ncbi:MAG: Gfo/Idh/MocA family oxidoreductase [Ruminococcaceae bacterium]|nr:Gfo/Idh/MocA family oxidoreductase [Oscillospiraceae bacterium]
MEKNIIKVGVISCSNMAIGHMRGVIRHPKAELVAICDTDVEKMNRVGDMFGIERRYENYKDLLAQEDIDAVIIVTPDKLHKDMAVDALAANKHVLCEKPLALTREDCVDIANAVKKSDRKFMVGQICRYTPAFKAAKEIIDRGEIGELMFVESEYAHDYEKILKPGNWRWDPLRNGVVGGGCHAVDLLRWVAGDPEEVQAYSNHKIFDPELPYDDTTIAIMKFPNNVIGKVFVSVACKREYTMRSLFYGTKGTIICDNKSNKFELFKTNVNETTTEGLMPKALNTDIPIEIPVAINNHNASAEFEEFASIILNDKPVATTVYEGAKTVAACFAIVEAAETGKVVKPNYEF